jgi:1-acyl-sn-glycerol-3-phosphate acyltransferase
MPGTIVAEALDPIAPGLSRDAFFDVLQSRLEEASARLLAEGMRDLEAAGVRAPEKQPAA